MSALCAAVVVDSKNEDERDGSVSGKVSDRADPKRLKFIRKLGIHCPSSGKGSVQQTPNLDHLKFFPCSSNYGLPSRSFTSLSEVSGLKGGPSSSSVGEVNSIERTDSDGIVEVKGTPTPTAVGISEFELKLLDLRKDDFRVNYLRKLSYANVWVPCSRRSPRHQTVIIFDWDDTLLCTSYIINSNGSSFDDVARPLQRQLDTIESNAIGLLEVALKLGQVFIITNARNGWVEYSAMKYLPGLVPVLEKVTVISARHRYEGAFPGEYHQWKIHAFLEVQQTLNNQIITNLISVGDSVIEMEAVHVMGKEFEQALVKTVKFRDNPFPDELARQLELVRETFESICMNPRNLKIGLIRKRNVKDRNAAGTLT